MEAWQSPVYCTCLENRRLERVREFESHRFHHIAAVAHRVEQQTENLCVAGSSPARGTNPSPLLMAYNRTSDQQPA